MSLTYFKVVRVMCRGYFYTTCTEFPVNITVSNKRNFSSHQRQYQLFAYKILVSFIIRMYCNRSISKHSLRSGGGYFYKPALFTLYRIVNMPKIRIHFNMFNLSIGNRSLTYRTPVYDL